MILPRKTVYVNDVPIGEAATWNEVRALLRAKGIWFLGQPRAAEGPTGFFLQGTATSHAQRRGGGAMTPRDQDVGDTTLMALATRMVIQDRRLQQGVTRGLIGGPSIVGYRHESQCANADHRRDENRAGHAALGFDAEVRLERGVVRALIGIKFFAGRGRVMFGSADGTALRDLWVISAIFMRIFSVEARLPLR